MVVVGIDFSPASDPAIETAIRTAKEHRGRIVLVHALQPLGAPGLDPSHPPAVPEGNESAGLASSIAANPAQRLRRLIESRGVKADIVTRPGPPVQVLAQEAERLGASVVVVGTHGHTGMARTFLGSVAEGVLRACRVPVVIVPGDGGPEYHAPASDL